MPIQQVQPRFANLADSFFKGYDSQAALNQQNRFANLKEDQINQQNRFAQQRSDLDLKQDARLDRTSQRDEELFQIKLADRDLRQLAANPSTENYQSFRGKWIGKTFDEEDLPSLQDPDEVAGFVKNLQGELRGITSKVKGFAPILTDDGEGNVTANIPTIDDFGNAGISKTQLEGNIINKAGESPEEKSQRLVVEARRKRDQINQSDLENKPKIEEAVEEAKLKSQLKYKSQIEKAVILARKAAKEKGEVLTDLGRAKASLPGLTEAVNQLKGLASIATSTFGGRVWDAAVKETGFGATKGSTARARFISIVNNQVLPLLKPTFGAAFTVQEGESLKATMGDPNAAPEEKIAQLESFIAQKLRDIETKQAQVSGVTPPAGMTTPQTQADFDALPSGTVYIDPDDGKQYRKP